MRIEDLRPLAADVSDYTELRWQENRSLGIALVKGSVMQNARSSESGVSARVYRAGAWGFASDPNVNVDAVRSVRAAAAANARFLDDRERKQHGSLPARPTEARHDFSTSKPRWTQKELLGFMKELDNHIAADYPDLLSRTVVLRCLDMEKALVTADGSAAQSLTPRAILSIVLSAEADGHPVEISRTFGGLGHFEDVFDAPDTLYARIAKLYEQLKDKQAGVYPEAGYKECVLDSELAGILAHEAIGHTAEGDFVLSGSAAADYLGKEAASPLVTLVDFAHTADGSTCPVPVHVDDEGTEAMDVTLIKDGILQAYLHSKETALLLGAAPTGNARAFQFSDEPLVRMRNTAFLPGNDRLEDMIASIDDGYYLIRPSNGQADATSEFMFGVTLGYEIKQGKLGRAIKDTTISGVAFDMLKTVSMVSDDMTWMGAGMCGKKQMIPTGFGGPALKCRVMIGGR